MTSWRPAVGDLRTPLLRNAAYLSANEFAGAGLGLAFWILAAFLLDDATVGLGTAIVTVGALAAIVASLGFTVALVRFVPSAGERRGAYVATALEITLAASVATAAVYLALAPLITPALAPALASPADGAVFVLFASGWAVSIVLDAAFVGAGSARPVLARGALAGLVRIALLATLAGAPAGPQVLPLAWGAALWIANGLGAVLARRTAAFGRAAWGVDLGAAREMATFAAANHAATLLAGALGQVLPVLILHRVGTAEVAYFYIAWMVSNLLVLLPAAVQTSVLAEASRAMARAREHVTRGLLWTYVVLGPATALAYVLAPWILGLFGAGYAGATDLLRVLLLSGLLHAFNAAYMTRLRLENRLLPLVGLSATSLAVALAGTVVLLPSHGLAGAGIGVLLGQATYVPFALRGLQDLRRAPPVASPAGD